MKIALTFNLKHDPASAGKRSSVPLPRDFFAECDSPETIGAVRRALESRGDRVVEIEADASAPVRLQTERPDLVFNMAEGLIGPSREALIPAVCELLNLPYTGSDPLTLALTLDKARTGSLLRAAGIPAPEHRVVRTLKEARAAGKLGFPAMVKPLHEGSSKGITNSRMARNARSLRAEIADIWARYRQPALVERFLPGREFTVALIGNPPGLRVLPLVEIDFSALPEGANPIYSWEAKWEWDRPEQPLNIFHCPAQLPPRIRKRAERTAREAFVTMGCRDWARIDLRADVDGTLNVIEINPLPGILPKAEDNSCFPKAARAAGLSYDALVQAVVDAACLRLGLSRAPHRRHPEKTAEAAR